MYEQDIKIKSSKKMLATAIRNQFISDHNKWP